MRDFDEAVADVHLDLGVVILEQLEQYRQYLLLSIIFSYDVRHLTQSHGYARFKRGLGIRIRVLKGREQEGLDFLGVQVFKTMRHTLDRCILNLRFVIIQEGGESLDQVAICDFLAESVR